MTATFNHPYAKMYRVMLDNNPVNTTTPTHTNARPIEINEDEKWGAVHEIAQTNFQIEAQTKAETPKPLGLLCDKPLPADLPESAVKVITQMKDLQEGLTQTETKLAIAEKLLAPYAESIVFGMLVKYLNFIKSDPKHKKALETCVKNLPCELRDLMDKVEAAAEAQPKLKTSSADDLSLDEWQLVTYKPSSIPGRKGDLTTEFSYETIYTTVDEIKAQMELIDQLKVINSHKVLITVDDLKKYAGIQQGIQWGKIAYTVGGVTFYTFKSLFYVLLWTLSLLPAALAIVPLVIPSTALSLLKFFFQVINYSLNSKSSLF
jgi:hypothetical protein